MTELLGVPRDTLLKAITIARKDWVDGEVVSDDPMRDAVEHAFAEWLVGKGCLITQDSDGAEVLYDSTEVRVMELIGNHEHYLTALAMAVCEIGETGAN